MIVTIGPLTLMDTDTRKAYGRLARAAYELHQRIWYTDDLCNEGAQASIRDLDAALSDAISHTPPEDIRNPR